jgi:hypothetical protein
MNINKVNNLVNCILLFIGLLNIRMSLITTSAG